MGIARTALVAAALAVLSAGVPVASAEPFAGHYLYLDASAAVRGADGSEYLLRVFASKSQDTASRTLDDVVVEWSRCDQGSCRLLSRQHLDGGQTNVAADRAEGDSLNRLAGGVLTLRLAAIGPQGGAGEFTGVRFTADPVGVGPELRDWRDAAGTLSVVGLSCRVKAGAQIGYVYTLDSRGPESRRTDEGAPVPPGIFRGPGRARCADRFGAAST